MPGFMPGIHAFLCSKAWMAGTSPAMTRRYSADLAPDNALQIAAIDRGALGRWQFHLVENS